MTSFLFIVSFLLHILLLITVFYLYQHIQSLKNNQTSEVEHMLNNFLQQLKLENEELEKKIHQANITPDEKQKLRKHINEEARETKETNEMSESHKTIETNESSYEFPPIHMEEPNVDQVETSLHSQVFHLHKKGLTIEEIAKKLNRGKTEIELIIKLNPQ